MFNVLAIGYGRQLFNENNSERKRMEACAKTVSSYNIIVFTLKSDGLKKVTGDDGLTIYPTNSKNKFTMIYDAWRLGKTILKDSSNKWVVTSQDPFEAGLVGFLLTRQNKLPFNIQEHGDFFSTSYWRRDTALNWVRYVVGRRLLKRATSVRVVSRRIKDTMAALGIAADRILSLPVRSDEVSSQEVIAAELGFEKDTVVVLTMARLEKQKNLLLLIESFAAVYRKFSQARLVIIGRGSEAHKLKQIVTSLHLDKVVKFVDWTDEPASYLKAADIYALSSDWEGWARVLVEAMAYGLPIVTTDVGCAGEVVINDKHGFVVPVRDQDAFTASLSRLVESKEIRNQFSKQALLDQEMIRTETVDDYAKGWFEVLRQTFALKRG